MSFQKSPSFPPATPKISEVFLSNFLRFKRFSFDKISENSLKISVFVSENFLRLI